MNRFLCIKNIIKLLLYAKSLKCCIIILENVSPFSKR